MSADATESRKEEGCLRFDLVKDQQNPNKFMCYEVWATENALKAHMEMPHVKAWGAFQYGEKKPVVSKTVYKAAALVTSSSFIAPSEGALVIVPQLEIKVFETERYITNTLPPYLILLLILISDTPTDTHI